MILVFVEVGKNTRSVADKNWIKFDNSFGILIFNQKTIDTKKKLSIVFNFEFYIKFKKSSNDFQNLRLILKDLTFL